MKTAFGIIGFSLFLGTIVGLSSAPTVSVLVAALVGLIGLVVGAKGGSLLQSDGTPTTLEFHQLGLFGIFALAGVLFGLFVRTEDPFGSTIAERKAEWKAAEIEETQANTVVIFEETGLLPPGWAVADVSERLAIDNPVLFASSAGGADKLNPEHFGQLDDLKAAWLDEGKPWSEIAKAIDERVESGKQRTAFEIVWILASSN